MNRSDPNPRLPSQSRANPSPIEFNDLRELLRGNSDSRHSALGYRTTVPAPLYEAPTPGEPDTTRPVHHTTRQVSAKLVAAARRTFPLPAREEALEGTRRPPFRTAFSAIRALPTTTTSSGSTSNASGLSAASPQCEGDVLPFVAFGPLPRHLERCARGDVRRAVTSMSSSRPRGKAAKAAAAGPEPRKEPLYERMARQWEELERAVFRKDHAQRDATKQQQELRVRKRQARMRLEQAERGARKGVRGAEVSDWLVLEEQARESLAAALRVERGRDEEQARMRQLALEQQQRASALHELGARQRQVRERAERLVDVDRVKLEREEHVVRARLKGLEQELLSRAKRRETIRQQLEQDAAEERRQRAAQLAMQQQLECRAASSEESPTSPDAAAERRRCPSKGHEWCSELNGDADADARRDGVRSCHAAPESGSPLVPAQPPPGAESLEVVPTQPRSRSVAVLVCEADESEGSPHQAPGSLERRTSSRRRRSSSSSFRRKRSASASAGSHGSRDSAVSESELSELRVDPATATTESGSAPDDEMAHQSSVEVFADFSSNDEAEEEAEEQKGEGEREGEQENRNLHEALSDIAGPCSDAATRGLSAGLIDHGLSPRAHSVSPAHKHRGHHHHQPQVPGAVVLFEVRRHVVVCSSAIATSVTPVIRDAGLLAFDSAQQSTALNVLAASAKHLTPCLLLLARLQLPTLRSAGTAPTAASYSGGPPTQPLLLLLSVAKEGATAADGSALGIIADSSPASSGASTQQHAVSAVDVAAELVVTRIELLMHHGQQPSDRIGCAASGEWSHVGEPSLRLRIPGRGVSTEHALDLLQSTLIETAPMEIGPRALEAHLLIPGVGRMKRTVDFHVVAPLFVLEGAAREQAVVVSPRDVPHVHPAANAVVSRNPHASLERCVLTFESDSFPLDEWLFVTPGDAAAPAAMLRCAPLLQDSCGTGAGSDTAEDRDEVGAACGLLLLAEREVARYTKNGPLLVISFLASRGTGAQQRAEVTETVMRSVARRVQARDHNTQRIRVRLATAAGSLFSEVAVTVEPQFVAPPLMKTPSSSRPYRPNGTSPLQVFDDALLSTVQQSLAPRSIFTVSLLHGDPRWDRLFLTPASGPFYFSNNFLCNGVLRNKVGVVEQLSTSAIRIHLQLSCIVSDLQALLGQISLLCDKRARLGQRVVRVQAVTSAGVEACVDVGVDVGSPLLSPTPPNLMPRFQLVGERHRVGHCRMHAALEHRRSNTSLQCERVAVRVSTADDRPVEFTLAPPFALRADDGSVAANSTAPQALLLDDAPVGEAVGIGTASVLVTLDTTGGITRFGRLLEALRVAVMEAILCTIVVHAEDLSHPGCFDRCIVEIIGFKGSPSPMLLMDPHQTRYRQGSRDVTGGFALFGRGRITLPPTRTFASCELHVELIAGGSGDGEDVVEWLTPEQQLNREAAASTTTAMATSNNAAAAATGVTALRAATLVGAQGDGGHSTSLVVHAANRMIYVGNQLVGTFESLNLNGGMTIHINPMLQHQQQQERVAAAAVGDGGGGGGGGTPPPSVSGSFLDDVLLSAVVQAIAFRNSDTKLKPGPRIFSLRAVFGREEFKVKLTVDVGAALIAVPSFGKKVTTQARTLLPSLCPKLVVSAKDAEQLRVVVIRVEVLEGTLWGSNEDRVVLQSDDTIEVSNGLVSTNQGLVVGKLVLAEGSLTILVGEDVLIPARLLAHILRSIGFESTTTSASTDPRVIEYYVEERSGDCYYDTLSVAVHVPDMPAEVRLRTQKRDYVMSGVSMLVAPDAVVTRSANSSAAEAAAVLKVEFLQQHLAADQLLVIDNVQEGIAVSSNGQSIEEDGEEVATAVAKQNHVTVNFRADASLATVTRVLRSIAFRHVGRRDRQPHKKIQLGLRLGKLWTRVSLAVNMIELFFDPTSLATARLAHQARPLFSTPAAAAASTEEPEQLPGCYAAGALLPDLRLNASSFDPRNATITATVVSFAATADDGGVEGPVRGRNAPPLSCDADVIRVSVGVVPTRHVRIDKSPARTQQLLVDKNVVADLAEVSKSKTSVILTCSGACTIEECARVLQCLHVQVWSPVMTPAALASAAHALVRVVFTQPAIGESTAYVHALF